MRNWTRYGPSPYGMGRPLAAILCLLLIAATPSRVGAYEVDELYTVQVPLDPADPAARDESYRSALEQVLVRVTGSPDAAGSPLLAELFPNPARYVLRFRPGEDNTLWVSLDGDAIENVLRQAGQTVWGKDRPLTLVWLAVDWGGGQREIVAADDSDRSPGTMRSIDRNRLLRERVLDTARRRGVPMSFPLLDTEDLEHISFSDIWGGFDEQLLQASQRYGANAVLVARVRPATRQAGRWTLYLGNEVLQFSGEPEAVVNSVADTMASEFAFAGDASVETVHLTVSGVSSLDDFGAMQQIMKGIGQIEKFTIDTVAGDRIRYVVQVYGGADRLGRALQRSGKLEPDDSFGSGPGSGAFPSFDALYFVYRP